MRKKDLDAVRTSVDVLAGKLDAVLARRARILVVMVNGRTVGVRSTDPTVEVDTLDLDLPEGTDPPHADLVHYPFEIY